MKLQILEKLFMMENGNNNEIGWEGWKRKAKTEEVREESWTDDVPGIELAGRAVNVNLDKIYSGSLRALEHLMASSMQFWIKWRLTFYQGLSHIDAINTIIYLPKSPCSHNINFFIPCIVFRMFILILSTLLILSISEF